LHGVTADRLEDVRIEDCRCRCPSSVSVWLFCARLPGRRAAERGGAGPDDNFRNVRRSAFMTMAVTLKVPIILSTLFHCCQLMANIWNRQAQAEKRLQELDHLRRRPFQL
jgi:hypothetical protein